MARMKQIKRGDKKSRSLSLATKPSSSNPPVHRRGVLRASRAKNTWNANLTCQDFGVGKVCLGAEAKVTEGSIADTSNDAEPTEQKRYTEEEHEKKMEVFKVQLAREQIQKVRDSVQLETNMTILELQEQYWKNKLAQETQKPGTSK